MNDKAEVIKDLKKAMEFYQELGFEQLPVKKTDLTEIISHVLESKKRVVEPPSYKTSKEIASPFSDNEKKLRDLQKKIGDCQRCRLSKGRKNIVFGEGSPDAEIIFIGEGPGREEDLQARPFVGEAGKVLTNLIKKMGLRREDVYIANIVKCRPPSNRDPEDDEMEMCSPFIDEQIMIIQPKIIVALGRISAQTLVGTKTPISKLRGKICVYKGIPVMPTFHPAYLMRNPKDKWLTWDDMQQVLKRLNQK